MKKNGFLIVGSAFALLGAIFFAMSFKIHVAGDIKLLVSPRLLPQVYSLFLLLLSLVFIWEYGVRAKHSEGQNEGSEEDIAQFPAKVLLSAFLSGLYIFLMPIIGYFVSSAIGFIVLLRLVNVRRWSTVLGFTGCFLIFVWVVFVKVLMISLPVGFLI